METVKLTSQKFLDLSTHSLSDPTGIVIGKQWKREWQGVWYLCEYVACDAPGYVDIKKKKIEIENESQLTQRPPDEKPAAVKAAFSAQNILSRLLGWFSAFRR